MLPESIITIPRFSLKKTGKKPQSQAPDPTDKGYPP
jgi:hypothetical protein